MKVSDLIKELQKQDQNRQVIISKDSEGNDFSPLDSLSTGSYLAETSWYGEIGLEELTEEDKKEGYSEEDVVDGVPALILWPVN